MKLTGKMALAGKAPRAVDFTIIDVPMEIAQVSWHLGWLLAPARRSAGFADTRKRGENEALELRAKLVVWALCAQRGVPVAINITANAGDAFDLRVRQLTVNIKASRCRPRDGLHLFVKAEERPADLYVQCFEDENRIVIAGAIGRARVMLHALDEIPCTNGHRGRKISCEMLTSWPTVMDYLAQGCVPRS